MSKQVELSRIGGGPSIQCSSGELNAQSLQQAFQSASSTIRGSCDFDGSLASAGEVIPCICHMICFEGSLDGENLKEETRRHRTTSKYE